MKRSVYGNARRDKNEKVFFIQIFIRSIYCFIHKIDYSMISTKEIYYSAYNGRLFNYFSSRSLLFYRQR